MSAWSNATLGIDRDGTRQTVSPAVPRRVRLVAMMVRSGQALSRSWTVRAQAENVHADEIVAELLRSVPIP